jgi:hypothetical protein
MDRHQNEKSARFGPLHSWRELAIRRDPAEGGTPPQG